MSKVGAVRARRWVLVAVAATATAATAVWWRQRTLAELELRLTEQGAASALEAVDAFLARHPKNERALSLRARALTDLGRWDEADQIFSQIGVYSPEEMRAWATALVYRQRWSEAAPLLARLLEANPDDPLALRHNATCQFQLGHADAALDSAARLATIPGHEAEGLFLSGVIHRARNEARRALDDWTRVEAMRPDGQGLPIPPAEFFLIYGKDLLSEGLPWTALTRLQKSRELEESLEVLLQLGKASAMIGKEAEAAAAWTRALEYDPNNHEARNGLAELALGRSDPSEALQWLTPAASSLRVSSATAFLMERAHTLLGNDEELEHWQRQTADLRAAEKRQAALEREFRRGL